MTTPETIIAALRESIDLLRDESIRCTAARWRAEAMDDRSGMAAHEDRGALLDQHIATLTGTIDGIERHEAAVSKVATITDAKLAMAIAWERMRPRLVELQRCDEANELRGAAIRDVLKTFKEVDPP